MEDNNTITWTQKRVRLGDLIPWEHNPRQISTDHAERLSESLDDFGQIETIAVSPELEVYNGHQRLNVWREELGDDYEVDVRVSSRNLTEQERKKLTVYLHHSATGEWDFETMANHFDLEELHDWGFDLLDLELEDEKYTRNIEAPIYEPSDQMPEVSALYDQTKTNQLLSEIEKSALPEDIKEFLRVAAQRHTVLYFDKIADYYAHSTPEVQRLMEDSALVIIDFHKAIELGYVQLSKKIAELYGIDYPHD